MKAVTPGSNLSVVSRFGLAVRPKSETKMTASVLKQDPDTRKVVDVVVFLFCFCVCVF